VKVTDRYDTLQARAMRQDKRIITLPLVPGGGRYGLFHSDEKRLDRGLTLNDVEKLLDAKRPR
jgi:hypothetical protein